MRMTSSKPYLLRALYEWIVDNNCTPQLLVDTSIEGVSVPPQFIENDHIVLNISPNAVRKLLMNEVAVEFDARFGGAIRHIYVPVQAVESIFTRENSQGMMFGSEFDDQEEGEEESSSDSDSISSPSSDKPPPKGKPHLKIVK